MTVALTHVGRISAVRTGSGVTARPGNGQPG
jgi:hypothetical protein